jgi:GT2 family glycosyltransferase
MEDRTRPRVRLVVLNYNGGAHVLRCLEHLEQLDWPRDRLDLVVVDNASQDGSDRAIEGRFPDVRLIRTENNRGFPANNEALRDLDGIDFVGLVNNDAFVEPGWLAPLVAALAADGGLGAACPKILFDQRVALVELDAPTFRSPGDARPLGVRVSGVRVGGADRWDQSMFLEGFYPPERGSPEEPELRWTHGRARLGAALGTDTAAPDSVEVRLAGPDHGSVRLGSGTLAVDVDVAAVPKWIPVPTEGPFDVVNNAGSRIVAQGYAGDRGFLEVDRGQFDTPAEVFAWCGAGVLFRRQYLADVGLFDERFFLYYEDTDLSWRGRSRGWRYRYVPESVERHLHAASSVEWSPLFRHYVERNRLLMLVKNAPWQLALREVTRFAALTARYAVRDIVRPALRLRRPAMGLVRSRTMSLLDFARLLPSAVLKRRRIRRRRQVADAELLAWMEPA